MEERESFYSHLDSRVAAIDEAWVRLKGSWSLEHLQPLYKRVCEISEDSQRLGMFQLNEGAFSLEVYLSSFVERTDPPSAKQIAEIEGLVRGLLAVAQEGAPQAPPARPTTCSRSIYLLCDQSSPAASLADAIRDRGCQVTAFDRAEQLVDELGQELPALIVTDNYQLDRLGPLRAARERLLSEDALELPLVFISDQTQLSVRVAAMRSGGSAYFVTPLDTAAVADQLAAMSEAGKEQPSRVTVVEDDPAQAEFAASILRRTGMEVDIQTDPMQVVDGLHAFRPDLILMDIYMPDVDGLELTRIIRDFNDFVTTPIVFLSGERDAGKQMDALSVGGDDFIAKPIDPRRLISVVTHRIRRSRRMLEAFASSRPRDAVTGLLGRRLFLSHAADVLENTAAGPACNALLFLQPVDLDDLQHRLGLGALDATLAEAGNRVKTGLAAHDLACRWRDHGMLVLLRRDSVDSLADAAEQLHQVLGNIEHEGHPVPFDAGLHPLQRSDEDLDLAIEAAMAACRRATVAAAAPEPAMAATPLDEDDAEEPDSVLELEPTNAPPPTLLPNRGADLMRRVMDALAKDSFGVYYQPLLDLQTQGKENYEILLALPGPEGETLTWRKLSEPAKRAGVQRELDRWVLERAMDILMERLNSGRHTQIFVRQSEASVVDPDHPAWLAEALRARNAQGNGLVLDYALTDLSQDVKAARTNRAALADLGVQLAISRFVARPAAYKVLRYLDADYVRVARKLLKADRETISNLIAEAHRLNARVIVSHVDDPRSIDLHWSSGADYLQGNFIQRPLEDMDYDFSQVVI